ncbi:group II truncated hemoglobin [Pseudocolwellia agarivorans]|uniref:group II truncated hemoglobin n=1 Tax=Pseudocolwellia agarivorans TaxID=1911682 RepID=UPI003F8803C4
MKTNKSCEYGVGDNSYKMAGELAGIIQLVEDFYHNMATLKAAENVRNMHSKDLTLSSKKLAYFLSGWLGGPKLYAEHFGGINIPLAHKHLTVGVAESEAWLLCMQKAVDKQNYEAPFKLYLMEQLRVPAERIRQVSTG